MGKILDGKKISEDILNEAEKRVDSLRQKGTTPGLATVLVGDDPASHVYVGQKINKCESIGMNSIHRALPQNISQLEVLSVIGELNDDPTVHGMIIQLPLPKGLDSEAIIAEVDPKKDADGLHPYNQGVLGRLKTWNEIVESETPIPCTPAGVIQMILRQNIEVSGKHVVVVGRSTLVGKPVAQLFLSLNATVTIAHSRTPDLPSVCKQADILVSAIGKPHFLTADYVKKGAVVIDVGISRTDSGLKGDVNFDLVKDKAAWITPVPGGVGPMTVAMLIDNTIRAAEKTVNSTKASV